MTRKEVIKILLRIRKHYQYIIPCEETIAIDMAIEVLQAEAEWIPVSKRLPDTGISVLVSDGVYVWEDELQEDYEDGKTVYWWDSQCSFDFNDTAWMPKPKPYKGGDSE